MGITQLEEEIATSSGNSTRENGHPDLLGILKRNTNNADMTAATAINLFKMYTETQYPEKSHNWDEVVQFRKFNKHLKPLDEIAFKYLAVPAKRINEKVLTRNPQSLELRLNILRNSDDDKPACINRMDVNDRVAFEVMVLDMKCDSVKYFLKFTKTNRNDNLDYIISSTHTLLDDNFVINKDFTTADDSWRSVADEVKAKYFTASYVVKFDIKIAPINTSFASIYEDTDITDFELRGVDGSVRMHKAVAASCSPFFKTLFMGSWRETAGGIVDVPDTSIATLHYLKDYMYLGKVPESDDLRQLLLLSSCYMMSDLESRCSYELSRHATTENAYDLIDFAVKHKLYRLLFAILQMVKHDDLSLEAMIQFYT